MKKFCLFALCLITLHVHAETATNFPEDMTIGNNHLQLCSSAKVKAFGLFKVGIVGLYLSDCSKPESVLEIESKLIRFYYQREIPADAFSKSAKKMLSRNMSDEEYIALEQDFLDINNAYRAVTAGDFYDISYDQQAGFLLCLNNEKLITKSTTELATHYFRIWFGEKPFNKKLKRQLLNQYTVF